MEKSFAFIKQEANILFQIIKDHEHKSGSINFYATYAGPLGGTIGNKKIKVDITRQEQIEFDVVKKPVFAEYTDLQNEKIQIKSYQLQEVLIEKMAALMRRTQPRDFYDLWYLLHVEQINISDCLMEFERKARHNGLNPKDFVSKVAEKEKIFKTRWEGSLQDQISELPDFEDVIRALKKHFRKLPLSS